MKEVLIIKFTNLEEAKKCYGEESLIPISEIRQIIYYAKVGCQPKFVWESEKQDGKIVAWYLRSETIYARNRWQETKPVK